MLKVEIDLSLNSSSSKLKIIKVLQSYINSLKYLFYIFRDINSN